MFINLTRFHSFSIFNSIILLVSVMILRAFLNLYVWLILIRVLVSKLLGWDLGILRWLTFPILKAFLPCKDNFIQSMFDVCPDGHYLQIVCMRQYVICIHSVRNGTLMHMFVPTIKKYYFCWFIHNVNRNNSCFRVSNVFNGFVILYLGYYFTKYHLPHHHREMWPIYYHIEATVDKYYAGVCSLLAATIKLGD